MFIHNILISFISKFYNIQLNMDDLITQEKSSKIRNIILITKRKTVSILKDEIKQVKNEIEVLSIINNDEISKKLKERISILYDVSNEFDDYSPLFDYEELPNEEIIFLKNQIRPLIYKYIHLSMRVS